MASLFGGFTFQSRVLLRFVTCPTSRGVLSNRTNSTGHYSWIKGGGGRYPLKDNEDKENGAKKRLLDIAALMVPTTVQHIFRLLLRKSRSETDFSDAIACLLYSGGRGQGVLGVCLCVFVYFIHLFVFIFFFSPSFWWTASNAGCNDVFIDSFAFSPLCFLPFRFVFYFLFSALLRKWTEEWFQTTKLLALRSGSMRALHFEISFLWTEGPSSSSSSVGGANRFPSRVRARLQDASLFPPPVSLVFSIHDWNQSQSIHSGPSAPSFDPSIPKASLVSCCCCCSICRCDQLAVCRHWKRIGHQLSPLFFCPFFSLPFRNFLLKDENQRT